MVNPTGVDHPRLRAMRWAEKSSRRRHSVAAKKVTQGARSSSGPGKCWLGPGMRSWIHRVSMVGYARTGYSPAWPWSGALTWTRTEMPARFGPMG